MDYLYSKWDKILRRLKDKFIFIFLDYDGTISPIASTPSKAVINKGTKNILKSLSLHSDRKVAIVTGRALKDIKKKIGLQKIVYVGNHGFEIEGPKIKFTYPQAPGYSAVIRNITNGLEEGLSGVDGVIIENKNICLSLHYRMAKEKDIPLVKAVFQGATLPYVISGRVTIRSGKKLLEVTPKVNWNKGNAVMWLLARQKVFLKGKSIIPIYMGDDLTDEDAFRVLKKRGITVFIGKPKVSYADYYLKGTQDVMKLLRLLEGM